MRISHLSGILAITLVSDIICATSVIRNCITACSETETCAQDPHSHSSYCKFWLTKSVCFGLYWKSENSTEMCFYPNDPSCSQAFPVMCQDTMSVNSTSIQPTVSVRTSAVPSQSISTTISTTTPSSATTTTVQQSTSIESTVASSSAASSTSTSPTITTTPTTTTPLALSGRYCGSSDSTNLIGVQLNFDPTTVDITLSDYLNGSISNIPYFYDSSSGLVALTPTPDYVGFLNSLPLFLVPQDIVVVYTKASDQVTITVLGVIIQATQGNCDQA